MINHSNEPSWIYKRYRESFLQIHKLQFIYFQVTIQQKDKLIDQKYFMVSKSVIHKKNANKEICVEKKETKLCYNVWTFFFILFLQLVCDEYWKSGVHQGTYSANSSKKRKCNGMACTHPYIASVFHYFSTSLIFLELYMSNCKKILFSLNITLPKSKKLIIMFQ